MAGVPPVRVTGFGDTEQVDAVGAPEHVKFTVPENPLAAVAVRLNVAVAPAATVADAAVAATVKPDEPVPVSEIVCGLSVAESVSANVPVRVPLAVGMKVTATVQLLLGDREVAQLFVSEKSPLVCMWLICSPKGPGLVKPTVCAVLVVPTSWLANDKLFGITVRVGIAPWPVSSTVRGLPAELSVMVRVPLRVPVAIGVNVIWIAQVPPAGETVPQLFCMEKSPLAVALETVSAALPKSTMVTGWGALAEPTSCAGKLRRAGDRAAAGASVGETFIRKAFEEEHRRHGDPTAGIGCNALNTGKGEGACVKSPGIPVSAVPAA